MALNTHIEGLSIEELLRVISNSRLSGVLTIVDRLRSGRIVFTWGRVTSASTEGQERLGQLLLRKGLISAEDLGTALSKQTEARKTRPLGTILSSMGIVDTKQIQSVLREQMKDAFYDLMEWTSGIAHLQVDITSALASVRLDVSLDTQTLLLDAARRRDEAAGRAAAAEGITVPGEELLTWWQDGEPVDDSDDGGSSDEGAREVQSR